MKKTIILALALASATVAHAGRPLATEYAGVLERSECEVETYGAHTRSGGFRSNTLSTQLSCGVGYSTQLGLGLARTHESSTHSNALSLGAKTRLIKGEGSDASYSIAYGLIAVQPEGLSLRSQSAYLNGAVSKPLTDSLTGHLNLGLVHDRSVGKTLGTWNVAAEYSLVPGFEVMGEVYGQEGSFLVAHPMAMPMAYNSFFYTLAHHLPSCC